MSDGSTGTPQPGAVAGEFVYNGLPPEAVSAPGWPDLPASQAVNFVTATPVRLSDEVIYTVWGGATVEVGQYWSPITFETADDFYGRDAVKLSWDTGQYLAQLQLPSVLLAGDGEGLPVWTGACSRQTAEDTDGNPLSGWYLPGGGPQFYIDHSLFRVGSGPTAWNAPAPAPPAPTPPADLRDAGARLAAVLHRLADGAAGREGRDVVLRRHAVLVEAAVGRLPAREAAASLLGIGRHVQHPDLGPAEARAVAAASEDVVRLAHGVVVG